MVFKTREGHLLFPKLKVRSLRKLTAEEASSLMVSYITGNTPQICLGRY